MEFVEIVDIGTGCLVAVGSTKGFSTVELVIFSRGTSLSVTYA